MIPTLFKIFEKIIFFQLIRNFHHFKLLRVNYYGFRKNFSTYNAIIDTPQYIYDIIDSDHSVISVFLYFAKAFDSVVREILLQKKNMSGVHDDALDWFRSYLTQREQYLSINDTVLLSIAFLKDPFSVHCCFSFFINDFPK